MPSTFPINTSDPERIASMCIGIGYSREDVVTTLVKRCKLSRETAERIVDAVPSTDQEV